MKLTVYFDCHTKLSGLIGGSRTRLDKVRRTDFECLTCVGFIFCGRKVSFANRLTAISLAHKDSVEDRVKLIEAGFMVERLKRIELELRANATRLRVHT